MLHRRLPEPENHSTEIINYAKLWTQRGVVEDIQFIPNFDTFDKNAHIRIDIVPEWKSPTEANGNWSWVGTNSNWVENRDVSMQLALIGVEDEENDQGVNMFRRRVLHEFGHALGFQHEQARAPWADVKEKVVFPAALPPEAEKFKALTKDWDAQIGQLDGGFVIVYGKIADNKSVMMYPSPEQGGVWNTKLSAEDVKYANASYPKLNN